MGTIYYLAVDIGASSGRHMLAHMENGRIVLEEIYRFKNGADRVNGHLIWNTERLFSEVVNGMRECAKLGKIPKTMGIDTWGVDYVLLDENGKRLGDCFSYRDERTRGLVRELEKYINADELYERTGIQKQSFNTIYQLMADKRDRKECLEKADSLLMVPDYLNFLLTGEKKQEYTNATTTQLVNAAACTWDHDLIRQTGLPDHLFRELSMPGTTVGSLKKEIEEKAGFSCTVVLPATHDTGSAVMSVPAGKGEDALYISSGTWSLFGCERKTPCTTRQAREANFTNEGGYDHRYRFLKNIMGLWMIQSLQKECIAGYDFSGRTGSEDYSFQNLCDRAKQETISSLVPCNDERFLSPESMIREVQKTCGETGQAVPVTPWELARVIYRSLAVCYRQAAEELSLITGQHWSEIHVVGGGSNAVYLNELTAEETGLTVSAGPGEATAIGNIGAQMIADGVFADLADFRRCVRESFEIRTYVSGRKEENR